MPNQRDQKPVIHTRKHLARLERERRQTRWILAAFIGILVIVVGLLVYGFVDLKYLQPRRPVAKIGEVVVPIKDWQARVRMERQRLINQISMYQQYQDYLGVDLSAQQQQLVSQLQDGTAIGQTVLDDMVNEEIIRQEAKARGIVAAAEEVEQSIQASYQYYPAGTPTASITPTPVESPTLSADTLALVTITPTPTEILTETATPTATADPLLSPTPTLAAKETAESTATPTIGPTSTPLPTATPMTQQGYEEAYKKNVEQLTTKGLSEVQLRQLYEVDILRERLVSEITADVPHVEEKVWARHILVSDEAVAQVVRARLVKGEDFAKVAAELSTDDSNKDSGGDLGWFGKGAMVPEFETAAFSLKVGEISQPIKTQFGYHIIQVLAHGDVPLDADAYESARQTAFDAWLQEARTKYNVTTYDIWQDIVPTEPAAPNLQ